MAIVLSLSEKNLDRAVHYVRQQKQHHQQAQTVARLERSMDEDDGPAPWNHGTAITGIKIIRD